VIVRFADIGGIVADCLEVIVHFVDICGIVDHTNINEVNNHL
jgi:hypothetical protein